jgi:hypothetical protein
MTLYELVGFVLAVHGLDQVGEFTLVDAVGDFRLATGKPEPADRRAAIRPAASSCQLRAMTSSASANRIES